MKTAFAALALVALLFAPASAFTVAGTSALAQRPIFGLVCVDAPSMSLPQGWKWTDGVPEWRDKLWADLEGSAAREAAASASDGADRGRLRKWAANAVASAGKAGLSRATKSMIRPAAMTMSMDVKKMSTAVLGAAPALAAQVRTCCASLVHCNLATT
eukprot:scaffold848_cov247-Pinguiococcus_pyrenoidosus.AAC.21